MHKILIPTGIYPPDIWWPASYIPKIATRLLRDGIDCKVITYSNVDFDKEYDNLWFQVLRVKRSKFFIWNYLKFFLVTLKHWRDVDLIYLQDYFSAGIPIFFANLFLRKKIVTKVVWIFSWEQSMNRGITKDVLDTYITKKQIFYIEIVKRIEKFLLRNSDQLITPSEYMRNLLINFWINDNKIKVIYNSFDRIKFDTINKLNEKKDLWFWDKKVYLSIWRLVKWKNFDLLIKEFEKIEDSILLIAWSWPLYAELERLIDSTNQQEKVFLLWSLTKKDLYNYYQIADIFVLISSYEGMSHALIEAMSMNLYIISSNILANTETLDWYNKKRIIELDNIDLNVHPGDILNIENTSILEKYNFENIYKILFNFLANIQR